MKRLLQPAVGLLVLWMAATLAFGGVAGPYERTHCLWVGLLFLFALAVRPQANNGQSPPTSIVPRWVAFFVAATTIMMALQTLPLPEGLLSWLSPLAHHFTFENLKALDIAPTERGYPVSLAPTETRYAWMNWVAFMMATLVAVLSLERKEIRRYVAVALCVFSASVAAFGLVHRFSGSEKIGFIFDRGWTFFGPYISKNHAGALFASALALSLGLLHAQLRRSTRIVLLVSIFLLGLGVVFTGSRGAFLALAAATTVHFFTQDLRNLRTRRWLLPAAMAVSAAVILAALWKADLFSRLAGLGPSSMDALTIRAKLLKTTSSLWLSAPVYGIGMGAFSRLAPSRFGEAHWLHPEHAENDLAEFIVCMGIVGIICAGPLLFFLIRRIVSRLHPKAPSGTRRGFALATFTLLLNSLFVFNAPLPAHQLLFALFLGGLFGKEGHRFSTNPKIRMGIAAATVLFVLMAAHSRNLFRTESREPTLKSPTFIQRTTANLLRQAQAETAISEDPLNAAALYTLADTAARRNEMHRARTAYEIADSLYPFDIASRRSVFRALAQGGETEYAWSIAESILESAAPLSSNVRQDIHVEMALLALQSNRYERLNHALDRALSLDPGDWRIPVIAYVANPEIPRLKAAWEAASSRLQNKAEFDRWLLAASKLAHRDLDWKMILAVLGPARADVGHFLENLRRWNVVTDAVTLDQGKPSPRFSPNTSTSRSNIHWLTPNGTTTGPEVFEIRLTQSQSVLDTYTMPVYFRPAPDDLSLRMFVTSSRPLHRQLFVVLNKDRILLSPETAVELGNQRYELRFSRLGTHIDDDEYVTGVGFTPLEKDGRYEIGPVQLFIDDAH